MKQKLTNKITTAIVFALCFIICSCKKDRTCSCKQTTTIESPSSAPVIKTYDTKKMYKKVSKKYGNQVCYSSTATYPAGFNGSSDPGTQTIVIDCKLE